MKKPILFTLLALGLIGSVPTVEAKPRGYDRDDDHRVVVKEKYRYDDRYRSSRYDDRYRSDRYDRYDRYDRRHRTRTIYIIENNRPVRRVVYVSPGGGYYRIVNGRHVTVRSRYYTSYPSKYYYSDGRRRVNVSFSF